MVGMTMEREITVSDIIAENEKRRDEMFSRFNPITGEGSVCLLYTSDAADE